MNSGRLIITGSSHEGIINLDILDLSIPIPVERLSGRIYIFQHQLKDQKKVPLSPHTQYKSSGSCPEVPVEPLNAIAL